MKYRKYRQIKQITVMVLFLILTVLFVFPTGLREKIISLIPENSSSQNGEVITPIDPQLPTNPGGDDDDDNPTNPGDDDDDPTNPGDDDDDDPTNPGDDDDDPNNPGDDDDEPNVPIPAREPQYILNTYIQTNKVSIQNQQITWQSIPVVEQQDEYYYLVFYANENDVKYVTTKEKSYSLNELRQKHNLNNGIVSLSVGYVNNDGALKLTLPTYHNAGSGETHGEFYHFNGKIADHYIENIQELIHISHYAFVNRIKNVEVKLSSSFNNFVKSTYFNSNGQPIRENNKTKIITDVFEKGFTETYNISIGMSYTESESLLGIEIGYNEYAGQTNLEPHIYTGSVHNKTYQDKSQKPYYLQESYLNKNHTKRTKSHVFESDKKLSTINVKTSEDLYLAVQNGLTPIFESTTSSASKIYENAKNILLKIISDDMTDYEKLLTIFDYITYETVYDYGADKDLVQGREVANHFKTAYYLEGVFNHYGNLDFGLAVCDAYSKAFSLLANMEGIETVRVVGKANGVGHAWNKVKLNNAWYVVDITWTEILIENSQEQNQSQILAHTYFLVSDKEIAQTHVADNVYHNENPSARTNYYYYSKTKFEFENREFSVFINTTEKLVKAYEFMISQYEKQYRENQSNGLANQDIEVSYEFLLSQEMVIILGNSNENMDLLIQAVNNYSANHNGYHYSKTVRFFTSNKEVPINNITHGNITVFKFLTTAN